MKSHITWEELYEIDNRIHCEKPVNLRQSKEETLKIKHEQRKGLIISEQNPKMDIDKEVVKMG